MRKIFRIVFGLLILITGLVIMFDSNCNSLSFYSGGGGRVIRYTCYANDEGAIPGWLGAGLFVAFALVLLPWNLFVRLLSAFDTTINSGEAKTTFQVTEKRPDISPDELCSLIKPVSGSGYLKTKGWYRDPARKYFERFWDGTSWTFDVRDADWKKQKRLRKAETSKVKKIFSPVFENQNENSEAPENNLSEVETGLTADLERLSELFSKGLLSESEFKDAKQRIINK